MILVCLSYQISHVIPIIQYVDRMKTTDLVFFGESTVEDYVTNMGYTFIRCKNDELKNLLQYRKSGRINKVKTIYEELHREIIDVIELYNIDEMYCDISRYMYYALPGYLKKIKVTIFWTYNGPTHMNLLQPPQTSKKSVEGKWECLQEWMKCFYNNEIKTGKVIFYLFYPYNFIFKPRFLKNIKYSMDGFFVDGEKIVCGPRALSNFYDEKTKFNEIKPQNTKKIDDYLIGLSQSKRKKIYITFGTNNSRYSECRGIIEHISTCLEKVGKYILLINVGELDDFSCVDKDNIFFIKNINQPQLIEECDLVIFHGGFGTLKECYFCNKKAIVIPFMYDQFANAKLICELNMGIAIQKENVMTTNFVPLVDMLLEGEKNGKV